MLNNNFLLMLRIDQRSAESPVLPRLHFRTQVSRSGILGDDVGYCGKEKQKHGNLDPGS